MSLESMTGYARRTSETENGIRLVCEIRSVNGKSLEIRLRLPPGLDRLEIPARQVLQNLLHRGSLQVNVSVEEGASANGLAINESLVESLLTLSEKLEARHGLNKPTIGELLAIRGVMETSPDAALDADDDILVLLRDTVSDLKAMRQREGESLVGVLRAHLDSIATLTARAEHDPARSPEMIRERLRNNIQALMETGQSFDEQRLSTEAMLLATRADVREELDRLKGHVTAARDLLAGSSPAGKKLDFLSQEFNREANTLCSKANAVSITRVGLELKSVVDQFREQVQNLE